MTDAEGSEPIALSRRLALRPIEAAEALGVCERTLRKWMRDEGLPYFRVDGTICIPVEALIGWMAARIDSRRMADDLANEILRDL